MNMPPPKTYQELLTRAGVFVQEVLPEADEFAQGVVAAEIAGKVWPVIEAWRSARKIIIASEPTPLQIGSTWVDRDKRCLSGNRRVTITGFYGDTHVEYTDGFRTYRSKRVRFRKAFKHTGNI